MNNHNHYNHYANGHVKTKSEVGSNQLCYQARIQPDILVCFSQFSAVKM